MAFALLAFNGPVIAGIGIVIAFTLVVLWGMLTYNNLVRTRLNSQNAWAQIDVQLKRRYDLIPNIVSTVKGYAGHEKETLERVIKARQQALDASGVPAQAVAENFLSSALRQVFALSEQYPDLKANHNFLALQEELAGTENKISFARQFYNDMVTRYNSAIQVFPSNLIAGTFHFEPREFFTIELADERVAPTVQV